MPASPKEVIYVDVDDEITAIIEKLQATSGKIVALVLPKRAAVFQSVVNMKLLKRTADSSKKSLVLITSEKSLMPLAGAVGLHVANTLQSKPVVPSAPSMGSDSPVSVDEIEVGDAEVAAPLQRNQGTTGVPKPAADEEETIEIDDEPTPKGKKAAAAAAGAAGIKKFNKKLKVPDFNKFRVKLIAGGAALLLLIIGFVLANSVLPSAKVIISTNNAEIPTSLTINSSPSFKEVDVEAAEVPGAIKEFKKSEVQKAAATGQKDMGTKATGAASFSTKISCTSSQPGAIAAGTIITANGLSYVTQKDAAFSYDGNEGTPPNLKCNWKTGAVDVIADKAGENYNSAARDYTVGGRSSVAAKGSEMSGGTSKIVKVISQKDIDDLKNKIIEAASVSAKDETKRLLEAENYFAIADSLTAKDPIVTTNPGVDTEAEEVTVSVNMTFTMIGASKSGLDEVLNHQLEKKINKDQQKILDNGLGAAGTRLLSKQTNGEASFELDIKATVGVEQNADDIRAAVKGKKKNEAEAAVRSREGVVDVTVEYSPFWVSKVPGNPDKVKVEFDNKSPESSDE